MPTNDFEKQVQQKMEELKFVPSEAVWPAVEKQIRQRKERRRLLLWWWLLPFLAGGSIYYYANKTNKANDANIAQAPAAEIKKTTTNTNTNNNNNIGNGTQATDAGNAQKLHVDSAILSKSLAKWMNSRSPLYTRIYNNKGAAQIVRAGKRTTTAATDNNDAQNGLAEKQLAVRDNNKKGIGEEPVMDIADADVALKPAVVGPLGKMVFTASPAVPPFDKGASKKPARTKKKMEWVVSVHTGISGISSGFSPLVKSTAALDAAPSAFQSNNGVSAGASSQNYTATRPSDIKPGFSFGAGLSLRRYISPGFSLEAGLLYSYYSTSMTIGKKVDSSTTVQQGIKSVSDYYSNYSILPSANNTRYQNRYHYIEIPIRLEKQLGLQSPFSVQAGVTIGQLLGSNALQYDISKNVYYKDNSVFNKTQLTLSAGMDIRLWRYKSISLEIGPRLQYGLTNFFDKDVYGSRHLLFAGLETRIFFPKK